MKNALLIHGWAEEEELYDASVPTASNSHWFPWLSKQLMVKDILAVAVEMPNSPYPKYDQWKKEFDRYDITDETILVGHSTGGGFIVRWLSEHPDIRVGNVVLVAPWMGYDFGLPFDKSYFEFDIDRKLASRTSSTVILSSTNDHDAIKDSVKLLVEKIDNVEVIEMKDKGHFTEGDMGTVEFPELRDLCLR